MKGIIFIFDINVCIDRVLPCPFFGVEYFKNLGVTLFDFGALLLPHFNVI
jgi:hypothetical protein